MYYPSHGPDICGSRTFSMKCRSCGQPVFYFFCDHGSKVFFDSLGPPWPEHYCGTRGSQSSSPRPPGRTALTNMQRISFSVQSADHGLLPGMRRASIHMQESSIRRVSEADSLTRQTVRIDPISTGRETLVGRVAAVHRVDLAKRLGLSSESIGARLVGGRFPGLEAVQVTILVDDIDIDPAAVDLLSYTFWCEVSETSLSVITQDVVRADVMPGGILGDERRWIAEHLELLS